MKSRKKNVQFSHEQTDDESFDHLVSGLIEVVAEDFKIEALETLEPFERYTQKVRAKMYSDIEAFRSHFVKGYHALLEVIHKS